MIADFGRSTNPVLWDVASGTMHVFSKYSEKASEQTQMEIDRFRKDISTFSPDGTQLLAAVGPTAILCDVTKEIRVFQGNVDPVLNVAFALDGKQMVTKRSSGTALWDTANARKLRDFKGPWEQTHAPVDGTTGNWIVSERAISADLKQVATWDTLYTVWL